MHNEHLHDMDVTAPDRWVKENLVQRTKRPKLISLPVVRGLVGAVDAALILAIGMACVFWASRQTDVNWQLCGLVVFVSTVLAVNLIHLCGAYRPEIVFRGDAGAGRMFVGWVLAVGTILAIFRIVEPAAILARDWLLIWSVTGLLLLSSVRAILHLVIGNWDRAGRLRRSFALVGAGPIGQRFLRRLNVFPDPTIRITGVYDDRRKRLGTRCMGHSIVGTIDDLVTHIRERRIDGVIVALPLSADWRLSEIMNKISLTPVDVRLCLDEFGFQVGSCQVSTMGSLTLLNVIDRPLRDWRWLIKQVEDLILATFILLLIGPLMLVIAILIKHDSSGPVLFKQRRYGFNNELIEIYKFRTMYDDVRDDNAEQLTQRNDPRVTKLGAFLRRTSLDELPQFINVLRGEMSVVGPRPHALSAKAGGLLYQDAVKAYDARHRMKPGITGWAQVNGWRGETETVQQIKKRVEHDLYYIEHWSVTLDLKIVLRTVVGGFTGRYAY